MIKRGLRVPRIVDQALACGISGTINRGLQASETN